MAVSSITGAVSDRRRPRTAAGLELCKTAELFKTAVNLSARQGPESVDAETLATIAAHDRSIDHGPVQNSGVDVIVFEVQPTLGEIAYKSPGKTVPGAGGIEYVVQQIAGDDEVGIAPEQDCAVLAAFDDNRTRPHVQNLTSGPLQVVLA